MNLSFWFNRLLPDSYLYQVPVEFAEKNRRKWTEQRTKLNIRYNLNSHVKFSI